VSAGPTVPAGPLLVDTDVIIDYLRGRAEAVVFIEAVANPLLASAVTVAELHVGVRDGAERHALERFLGAFEVVPVDRDIAVRGGLFRRDYGKSHGVGLPDALIAATAVARSATLVTLNIKHFPMLTLIHVPYAKP
jgi:predicted nucleic acid-binding protein